MRLGVLVAFFLLGWVSFSPGRDIVFVAYTPVPSDLRGLYEYIDRNVGKLRERAEVVEVRTYADLVDRMLSIEREKYDSISVFIVGHSNGISLFPDVDAENFSLPYVVDLLVFDVCYVGTKNRILRFSKYAKKIIATDWEVPQWGMSPFYEMSPSGKDLGELMKALGEFYKRKMLRRERSFRKANLLALKFYGYDGRRFYTLSLKYRRAGVKVSLFREDLFPEKSSASRKRSSSFPNIGEFIRKGNSKEVL